MDIKRVILAVALSMVVLGAWTYFIQPMYAPTPQQRVEQAQEQQGEKTAEQQGGVTVEEPSKPSVELGAGDKVAKAAPAGRTITVKTPLYTAIFNTDGGVLQSFKLHKYKSSIEPGSPDVNLVSAEAAMLRPMELQLGGKAEWKDMGDQDITLGSGDEPATLHFTGVMGDVVVTRVLTFNPDTYLIDEDVLLQNNSQNRLKGSLGFTLDATSLSSEDNKYNFTRIAAYSKDGLQEEKDTDDLMTEGFKSADQLKWGGISSNYFLMAMLPPVSETADENGASFRASMKDDVYTMVLDQPLGGVEPSAEKSYSLTYFMGPKVQEILDAAPNDLGLAVNLGWFDFIAKPLLVALKVIYNFVGNYGIAIIILTVIIKLILWPLSHKSYKSMNQMKKLQPMMAQIREKYKDDRQKMNEEMMQLYKTYKVNPAGGCAPMLLQIPVFIGLYQALLNSIELRHASFISHLPFTDMIWLADLSAKDPYYITPIIMGATMFLQQKMTPAPGDPTQQKIMLFMPIFFTFIFLNFPSGLVVYWLVNNVLSIAQQWWMLRKTN